MLNRFITLCIITSISLFFAQLTYADPHECGTYVEANVGLNFTKISLFGNNNPAFKTIAFNPIIGYQFHHNFGAELGYTTFHDGLNLLDISIRAILPLETETSEFSIFGKIGPSYVFEGSKHHIIPFVGIGAAYLVTPQLDINIQAQAITQGVFALSLLSIGGTYHLDSLLPHLRSYA